MPRADLLFVEDALWVLTAPTGIGVYDFDFVTFLACRRPWQRPTPITAGARIGAFEDYGERYRELQAEGGDRQLLEAVDLYLSYYSQRGLPPSPPQARVGTSTNRPGSVVPTGLGSTGDPPTHP